MTRYSAISPDAPILVFGHGAGAGENHPWMRRLGQGLAARGVSGVTFNFPYMESQRRAPDPAPVLEHAFGKGWNGVASSGGRAFAGGKSMGGRISSQATAAGTL